MLVSCLMSTADRRSFVPQALAGFLAQTHHPRELLVLDDGADPVADLMPEDPRIMYVRDERRRPEWAKFWDLVATAADGLVAKWDDDDESAPERLAVQVAALEETGLDACVLGAIRVLDEATGRLWLYCPRVPIPVDETAVFRRSAVVMPSTRLRAQPLPCPAAHLLGQLGPARTVVLDRPDLYLYHLHAGCSVGLPNRYEAPEWTPLVEGPR